ncbi:MAG: hypothetical protein IIC01_03505 [Planctomycetes bacterium]|nr:hypothetical protein [Planctomycetota bacterium]
MAEPALMPFADNDEFLRRVGFDNLIKRDHIHWRAFKDKDVRMSLTFRDKGLQSGAGLDAYHEYFSELFGKSIPAILWLSFYGLTRCIDPPLEPKHDPDPNDLKYGHLHCSTNAPRDNAHMQLLAKLFIDGKHAGIARRYVSPQ